jgi:hypothetical protein
MKWLQRLIQVFSKGGRSAKTGRVIAKDIRYAEQLKQIASWEHTDRSMWEWWRRKLPQEKVKELKLIKQGKLTPDDMKRQWKSQLNTLPKTKQMRVVKGIPFHPWELDEINRVSKLLRKSLEKPPKQPIVITTKEFVIALKGGARFGKISKTGQKYTKTVFSSNPWQSNKEVTIHLLTFDQAKRIKADLRPTTHGWATGTEIYLVWEHHSLKTFGYSSDAAYENLKQILTHEIAHVKDPAIVRSSKLNSLTNYNPAAPYIEDPAVALAKNAPQNWLKNYYYNQKEIFANLAPVLTSITDATSKVVKQIGKKRTIAALAELQQWAATGTGSVKKLSSDSRKILGYTSWYQKLFKAMPEQPYALHVQPAEDQITGFFNTFKTQNPAQYKKMITKLAGQLEDLKKQVYQTRNLTPESVIKYKTILESK